MGGLGMPFHKESFHFGNLFVKFDIKFPDKVNPKQIAEFSTIFAGQKTANDDDMDDVEETCELSKFTEAHRNTHAQGGTVGDDEEEEDDDMRGGQRVDCQQQ